MTTSPDSPSGHCVSVQEVADQFDNEDASELDWRQSEDGGSLEAVSGAIDADTLKMEMETNGERSNKEREQENHIQDLDKDIDVVLDYNVVNRLVDLNCFANIESISVDSTIDSFLRNENGQWKLNVENHVINGHAVRKVEQEKGQFEGSEKSFTSDTDSSILADSVVKSFLVKAADIVRSEYHLAQQVNTNRSKNKFNAKVENKGVVNGGLFQNSYDDRVEFDDKENKFECDELDYGEEIKQDNTGNVEPIICIVGQQADADGTKCHEASKVDYNFEGQTSLNQDQANIMKLNSYKVQMEPISQKSDSSSDSENSLETNRAERVGVQRDVYEPQARKFSVTLESSSGESTPHTDSADDLKQVMDIERKQCTDETSEDQFKSRQVCSDDLDSFRNLKTDTDIPKNDENCDIDNEDIYHRTLVETVSNCSLSVSPLIQNESIKENWKFGFMKSTELESEGIVNTSFDIWNDSPWYDDKSPRETVTDKECQIFCNNQNNSPTFDDNQNASHRVGDYQNTAPRFFDNQNSSHKGDNPSTSSRFYDKQSTSLISGDNQSTSYRVGDYQNNSSKFTAFQKSLTRVGVDLSSSVKVDKNQRNSLSDVDGSKSTRVVDIRNSSSRDGAATVLETLHIGNSDNKIVRNCNEESGIKIDKKNSRKFIEKNVLGPKLSQDDFYCPFSSESNGALSATSISHLEKELKSSKQMNLSEFKVWPLKNTSHEELEGIRHITRDTVGRDLTRIDHKPYSVETDKDVLASESKYLKFSAMEKQIDRERLITEVSSRNSNVKDSVHPVSSYEEDLLRSAYDRVANQSSDKSHSFSTTRSTESEVIPAFKTFQQQGKWSEVFNTLEREHRPKLYQYEWQQYNIQQFQQKLESELQNECTTLFKKSDSHQDVLEQMLLDRDGTSNRNALPGRGVITLRFSERSTDWSNEKSGILDTSPSQSSFESKIHYEVRAEEERRRLSHKKPIECFFENDFVTDDTTLNKSRTHRRTSPPGSRNGDILSSERSSDKEALQNTLLRTAEKMPIDSKYSKADRESLTRNMSPEGDMDVLYRANEQVTENETYLNTGDGIHCDGISRHVKKLLDNLNNSHHTLHEIQDVPTSVGPGNPQDDIISDHLRAGVGRNPVPLIMYTSDVTTVNGTGQSIPLTLTEDMAKCHKDDDTHRISDAIYCRSADLCAMHYKDKEILCDSIGSDDSYLSPRTGTILQEKYAKHLANITAYEDERRGLQQVHSELRQETVISANISEQSSTSHHLINVEHKHLVDKCYAMQDEIDELNLKVTSLEQKNVALENRSTDNAAAYAKMQGTNMQQRAHIDGLQKYCNEHDELIKDLKLKLASFDDNSKIYKMNFEKEMELRKQKSLQRMLDGYESLEREYKLLYNTMASTENKLYEARTDIVELKRTITKLELENQRLGHENDNLRHKIAHSMNLQAIHNSFGSPTSSRELQNYHGQRSPVASQNKKFSHLEKDLSTVDLQLPSFSTAAHDWTTSLQVSRSEAASTVVNSQNESEKSSYFPKKVPTDSLSKVLLGDKDPIHKEREFKDSLKGRQSQKSVRSKDERQDRSSSIEELTQRTQQLLQIEDEQQAKDVAIREVTPSRPLTPSNTALSEVVPDLSHLLKTERELYQLRDMMRQAVAIKPPYSPPQPKLQKKFYISERLTPKDDHKPDLGISCGIKEKPEASLSTSVVTKSKSSQPQNTVNHKSSGTQLSSEKQEMSSKAQDKVMKEKVRLKDQRETERSKVRQRSLSPVRQDKSDSITTSDIAISEAKKTSAVTLKKVVNQSLQQRDVCTQVTGKQYKLGTEQAIQGMDHHVKDTLDKLRHDQFFCRPEWEKASTFLVKPKDGALKQKTLEGLSLDKFHSILELESQYTILQNEKKLLESSISKILMHGRVVRSNRKHKEELEDRLDQVENKLGSIRMSLKSYKIL